jgi:hypothetical protein
MKKSRHLFFGGMLLKNAYYNMYAKVAVANGNQFQLYAAHQTILRDGYFC